MNDPMAEPLPSARQLRKQYRAGVRAAVLAVPGVAGFDTSLVGRLRGDSGLRFRDLRKGGVRIRLRLKLAGGFAASKVAEQIREALMQAPHDAVWVDIYFGRIGRDPGAA